MSDQARYRVTGAVFLIALAVILLPMLFDGEGIEAHRLPPIETPDVPDTVEEVHLAEDAAFEEVKALRESVDEEGFALETETRVGEPVLSVADSGVDAQAWAVQLASFADRANAVTLRDRLRQDGYDALLSEAKQGGSRITRVAVGPIIERDEAERLRAELAARYQLDAMVVGFGV